jgi:hypothetical protein
MIQARDCPPLKWCLGFRGYDSNKRLPPFEMVFRVYDL